MIIDACCTVGTERETNVDVASLLQSMNVAGVNRAIICPEDREIAVHNSAGNERIRKLAAQQPDRFMPACSVNPWFGQAAVEEMADSVRHGAQMLVLAPTLQGYILGDELTTDLLEAAARVRLPVYIHTGPHGHAAPAQLAIVAQRHPHTRFIMGHCGSTDHAWDMPAILQLKTPNVWYELSFVRPWIVPSYASLCGEGRLIFGSNAPRNDLVLELKHFDIHWPMVDHPATYGGNIASLLSEVIHDC